MAALLSQRDYRKVMHLEQGQKNWNAKAAAEVDLKPGLPPLNPALQEFPITEISWKSLNNLLGTVALGPFIEDHAQALSQSANAEALVENIHEAIDNYDSGDNRMRARRKNTLYREIKQSEQLLFGYLTATGGIKITVS